jgi:hypothetical protein
MKNEIEQQIFEKMKAKDFGESMCNETKLNVLRWTMQQLRKHDVSGSVCHCDKLPDGEIAISSKALQKPYGNLGQTDC